MNIEVKSASENDIPLILGLSYDLGRPKPKQDSDVDDFRKVVKQYIKDSDKQILVAQINDVEIVGMVSIVFLPRLNHKSTELYIPELIVLEKYRNQGIGKKLIESSISLGIKHGCHRIRLESGNQRKESHQFYIRLGFEQNSLSFTKSLC